MAVTMRVLAICDGTERRILEIQFLAPTASRLGLSIYRRQCTRDVDAWRAVTAGAKIRKSSQKFDQRLSLRGTRFDPVAPTQRGVAILTSCIVSKSITIFGARARP
jgi:hypothetical protein